MGSIYPTLMLPFQTSDFDWPLDAFSSSLILLPLNVNFSENSLITSSPPFPSFLLETSVASSHKRAGRSLLGAGGCVIFITAQGRVSLILERKHCLIYSSVTHLCAKGLGSKDLCVVYSKPGISITPNMLYNYHILYNLVCMSLLLELFQEHAFSVQMGLRTRVLLPVLFCRVVQWQDCSTCCSQLYRCNIHPLQYSSGQFDQDPDFMGFIPDSLWWSRCSF